MKKLTALFMIISFLTVSTAEAFAEPAGGGRNRNETRRIERNHERRNVARRPDRTRPERRSSIRRDRPGPEHRQNVRRPDRPRPEHRPSVRRPDRQRPGQSPVRRPIIRRHDNVRRPVIRHAPRYPRYNNNFWGRAARSHRYYRDRPIPYYRPHYHRDNDSLTASEFFGISAAIIAIAAMINNMNAYDY